MPRSVAPSPSVVAEPSGSASPPGDETVGASTDSAGKPSRAGPSGIGITLSRASVPTPIATIDAAHRPVDVADPRLRRRAGTGPGSQRVAVDGRVAADAGS